ncbi:uncharacterized protein LOC122847351 [Aphidius gifuensis]|uniref:uncharacterized protein LOC122847351 n=1 Tax=Aphidius gifuensis TaxID=684658 RepID=UPI001CDD057A|nr:uncharacterized protein LOC122847351 [Aphidius gifuensis]
MTKLLFTIWSLGLNLFGINIFHICFANSMIDEDGEEFITGPQLCSNIFACGVYIIIVNERIFPSSFRKPTSSVICVYEFLVTAFILEFSVACIWGPIDVLIMNRLPDVICHTLSAMKCEETGEWIRKNQWLSINSTIGVSCGFLIFSLYVTRAIELSDIWEYGLVEFFNQTKLKLLNRFLSELPKADYEIQNNCQCPSKSKKTRKSHQTQYCLHSL